MIIVIVIMAIILHYSFPLVSFAKIPYITSMYTAGNTVVYRTSSSRYTNQKVYKNCYQRWLDLNRSITMVWFNDLDCRRYMRTRRPEVYRAYQTLRPGAFKADLFRLCILYERGGIYVDCEAMPYVSLREMLRGIDLQSNNMFVAPLDRRGIHNGFMIASPRHPFLAACIQYIVKNVHNRTYYDDDLAITGPIALAISINRYLGRPDDAPFKTGLNSLGMTPMYLYQYKNLLPQGPFQYIYKGEQCIMTKKHCVYSYMQSKLKPSAYFRMVRSHNVYGLPSKTNLVK